jgi:uncharacterized membrane protein (UPF0127 family)
VRKKIPAFLGAAALIAASVAFAELPILELSAGIHLIRAEAASTFETRAQGLMFRKHLGPNEGMFFVFPQSELHCMWMKNTLIPLSVAFIDKNGVILEIHDMKALDETITRSDSDQVAYALETNLHWFALNGVKPGDKIQPAPSTLGAPLP